MIVNLANPAEITHSKGSRWNLFPTIVFKKRIQIVKKAHFNTRLKDIYIILLLPKPLEKTN